ncbi:MAG TPA: UdgX family uracil-DNA binding protein [Terriglobales bacterium]|nr:UdgX family uracil-DNA binding protein [Terriglobales bacterium]
MSKLSEVAVLHPGTAAELIPEHPTLANLRRAAATCKACELWKMATQTVFGEGSPHAKVMFVGEQPGDREDLAGKPFVGPAGRLLDQALSSAGIDRKDVYVTNVVKHFHWQLDARGKRRIHKKPRSFHVTACRPWLNAELAVVRPHVLVVLGATAAQTLLGRSFSVLRMRGQAVPSDLAPKVVATVHPSSILRAPDSAARDRELRLFIGDLKNVAELIKAVEGLGSGKSLRRAG